MTQEDNVFYKQLGQRVAGLRKELSWTQAQLAEALAISQQLVAGRYTHRR